jgi:putative radical SAM enzyme (TIGR03279 family)
VGKEKKNSEKEKFIVVKKVEKGSIADEIGLESGDKIVSINGEKVVDIFDYRFLITDEVIELKIIKCNSDLWEIEIEKDVYEDLGLEFDSPMIDSAKSCMNKCIFCFIDQLPRGMRSTLYFKDDDTRLSFLSGNYVTLTNIKDNDLDKIVKYHMSPINISVHTTNPDLRIKMLNNKNAGDVMEKIKKLAKAGIMINCQIVLCRNINDGTELDRTISDLSALYPEVNSISVVPVGLTKYREGLPDLIPHDKISASRTIEQVAEWQERLLKKKGSRIVYPADEFYVMAGCEMPDYYEYEDFPQLENGVGLVALFKHEFNDYLNYLKRLNIDNLHMLRSNNKMRKVSIATGVLAYEFINGLARELEKTFENIRINVYPVKNDFFGEQVTVTGLLTGRDIIQQLSCGEPDLGEELLISESMLKANDDVFLDDYTVKMLEEQLNIKLTVVKNNGKDFILKAIGLNCD